MKLKEKIEEDNVIPFDPFYLRNIAKKYVSKYIEYDTMVASIWLYDQDVKYALIEKYINKEFEKKGITSLLKR